MQNCYELVQAQPNPPALLTSPPPILEWGALLTVICTGVGYLGKTVLQQWQTKEQGEFTLMKGLIDHLLGVQSQLIENANKTRDELIRHIDLKESVSRMAIQIEEKVNRALGGQTELYIESLKNQNVIITKVDALHKRQDVTNDLLTEVVGEKENASTR